MTNKHNILKDIIASIGWRMFLWGNNFTEEKFWELIYKQEVNKKINNK